MTPALFEISVNGQPRALRPSTTLAALVDEMAATPHAIATAVNGEFVARGQRHERVLCDGDHVTCFQPIVGG